MDKTMDKLNKGVSAFVKWCLLGLVGVFFTLLGFIPLLIIFSLFIFSAVSSADIGDLDESIEDANFSEEVLEHSSLVKMYAIDYGVSEYTTMILAIMQHETGGEGDDPMNFSQHHCQEGNDCVKSVTVSIKESIIYLSGLLDRVDDYKLAIQGYNFGEDFIDYVIENGIEEYSLDVAIDYSRLKHKEELEKGNQLECPHDTAESHNACYGDINYVNSVLTYLGFYSGSDGEWSSPVGDLEIIITSPFGGRADPKTGEMRMHGGVDIGCMDGKHDIYAVDDGEVVVSNIINDGSNSLWTYGNHVVVQHDEELFSLYAHMDNRSVAVGDNVVRGEKVGVCGNTGRSTGAHVHLEAKTGIYSGRFDPMTLLKNE